MRWKMSSADLLTRAKYRQEGAEAERERIIQKLRARTTKHNPILEMHIDDVEELIRGEQK
jgi:hypothetical protein